MQIPQEVVVWRFSGKQGTLFSDNNYKHNQGYNLFCDTNKKFLTWKDNMVSVNLELQANSTDKKVHFRLPDGQQRQILTGELVSFGIGGGEAFLYYGNQRIGVNLKWSKSPKFQWKIYDSSGVVGKPVQLNTPYALVNMNVEPDPDFLIFLEKHVPRVVDLGWTTSPDWIGRLKLAATELNKVRKMI